jgi:hypothetical protein
LPPNARFGFLHPEKDATLPSLFISSIIDFVNGGFNQTYLSASFLASHVTLRFRLGPAFGLTRDQWDQMARQDSDCAEASEVD